MILSCGGLAHALSENAAQAEYYKVDLRNPEEIADVFRKYESQGGIWGVVHLAALKAVGESGELPLSYYRVNIAGTISLLEVCLSIYLSVRGMWTHRWDPCA